MLLDARLEPAEGRTLTGRLQAKWLCPSETSRQQRLQDMEKKEALAAIRHDLFPAKVEWNAFDESYTIGDCGISYACSLVVLSLVEEAGSKRFVDLGPIRIDDFTLPSGARQYGFDFQHPVWLQSRVTVRVPEGYQVEAAPSPVSLAADSWVFRSQAVEEGGALVLTRDLRMTDPLVDAKRGGLLRTFFMSVYAQDRQTAVFTEDHADPGTSQ